jgi:hypothetical protein
MEKKPKWWFVVSLVGVLVVLFGIGIWLGSKFGYGRKGQIQVRSVSPQLSVQVANPEPLKTELVNWEAFKAEKAVLIGDKTQRTKVNNLELEFSVTEQPFGRIKAREFTGGPVSSFNSRIENGNLVVTIHLNPDYLKSLSADERHQVAAGLVAQQLYKIMNPEKLNYPANLEAQKEVQALVEKIKQLPNFIIVETSP